MQGGSFSTKHGLSGVGVAGQASPWVDCDRLRWPSPGFQEHASHTAPRSWVILGLGIGMCSLNVTLLALTVLDT